MDLRTTSLALIAALAAGCSAPRPEGEYLPGPPLLPVFQGQGFRDHVEVRAELPKFHQDFRDGERRIRFAQRQGLIPIALFVGTSDVSSVETSYRVDESGADIRLVLGDGTVLPVKSEAAIVADLRRKSELDDVRDLYFDFGPLRPFRDLRQPLYVFFEAPQPFVWEDGSDHIVFGRGGFLREIDLTQAVLTIDVLGAEMTDETIYVGVRRES